MKRAKRAVHVLFAAFFLFLALAPYHQAAAQGGWNIHIFPPDTSQFPWITFYMEPYDETGAFVPDLKINEVEILEDGKSRPLQEVSMLEPGLQFILAINEAPVMTNNYGGISFYNNFYQSVLNWAQVQPQESNDDYSLSTNTGLQIIRVKGSSQWVDALNSYSSNVMEQRPSLNSLSQALDLATDPNPDPLMKRAVLYITSIPDDLAVEALPNLTNRAVQLDVQVSVWLIDPSIASHARQAEPLLQLASQTGGTFFVFSGGETIPDLDQDLEDLRHLYRVKFLSQANTSGEHRFEVHIQRGEATASSENQTYDLQVLPPNPFFLDPPVEVTRTWAAGDPAYLQPAQQAIEILVEFPDGYVRELHAARLFVDGMLIAENTVPPYTQFSWPLDTYSVSKTCQLRVEVEDVLGLTQSTIETPVQVIVEELKIPWWKTLLGSQGLIVAAAVVVSASVLVLVMLLGTRRTLHGKNQRKKRTARRSDPLTQPVRTAPSTRKIQPRSTTTPESPTMPRAALQVNTPARLIRLSENELPVQGQSIALNRRELTFGGDPQQSICVLDSTSVNALHAHLVQVAEGDFMLSDANSVAGTWVNYAPVPKTGLQLKHGDLIHFGRLAYRFEMNNPPGIQKATISAYKEETL